MCSTQASPLGRGGHIFSTRAGTRVVPARRCWRSSAPLCYAIYSLIMTGSGISRGGGGGGPGDVFLLLLVAAEDEELDPVLNLRLLCLGMFAMTMTAMRRRMVAITAAAMIPPWTIVGMAVVGNGSNVVCKISGGVD